MVRTRGVTRPLTWANVQFELLGHVVIPLARAASNSVRATCSRCLVAAAPTGFAL